ncbi:MAG: hypothetical protein A2506_00180 [Elusimicrobia bacterium RIFOXYD12_FULL_66_9]|nr:MAG: hypothetical protein A2506_00180 [Elusimicrobia bacterium RIFOXYD12_FULL_66_9]
MNRSRLKVAAFVLFAFLASLWYLGRVYREIRAVEDAREALAVLGRMQEAHLRMQGAYTEDVSALADMGDDWSGFMESLNKVLDLRTGFEMSVSGRSYRIMAHARDKRSSVVVLEGPPKVPMAATAAPPGKGR